MERAQAYQTLNLHPSADGQMVADAYWRLVRSAQADGDSAEAHDTIERLNDAYTTLTPKLSSRPGVQRSAAATAQAAAGSGLWLLDVFADWVVDEAQRTRRRWPGRNLEIGLVAGASMLLMLLALGAGASLLLTFGAAIVALVGIWAPWRRPDGVEHVARGEDESAQRQRA
jgi:hypothetical protein